MRQSTAAGRWRIVLPVDGHKNIPRAVHAPGVVCRLLPQLVGFCIRAAVGELGDGMAVRIGPTKVKLRCEVSSLTIAASF